MTRHLLWGDRIFQLVHMHMARKALKFNRNIELGIRKENLQGRSSVYYICKTMSDAYSEHKAILKGLLLSQQWLKQSSVVLGKQPFPHV